MSDTNAIGGPGASSVTGADTAPLPSATPELERLGLTEAAELARGGFGVVYRAHQPALNRAVAVKVMTTEIRDEMTRVRFERECKAMGMLSDHPGIVTVFDAGFTHVGRPYIVMDLMTDGALSDRLEREGAFTWREVISIGVKVAGALETAHRAGILHRDIKPENIMMSGYGEPQLGDFGIARLQGGQETRTGTLTASIAHVAPELLTGEPPSVRTDLYALGSTMFSLLSGRSAFLHATDESIVPALSRITSDPVPDLRPSGVPDAVCALVERLMAKDPEERFASAEEAALAMQQLQRGSGVPVTTLRIPDLPVGTRPLEIDTGGATNNVAVPPTLGAPGPPSGAAGAPTVEVGESPSHATDIVESPGRPPAPPAPARKRTPILIAGVVVLALVGAGVAFALSQRTAVDPQVDDQPSEIAVGAGADPGDQADAAAGEPVETGQLARQVAEIRGLEVREPIQALRLGRADYDPLIREWSIAGKEEDLVNHGRVLTALHMLPADLDLVAMTQDLYAEQFYGFYDERTRRVYIRAESSALSALERSIVVDESITALLDQNYGVTQLHEEITDPEADRALTSLTKGDTFIASAVWAERFLTSGEAQQRLADISLLPDQVARTAPEALRAELVFPFVAGEQFYRAVFDEGGLDAVNEAYANPPTTTEQILHPRAYFRGEEAEPVEVTTAPEGEWTELVTRTFGEFDIQQLTGVLGTDRANAAGEGWGGGQLKAWAQGDQTIVLVALAFDTPADAEEACTAVRDAYRETTNAVPQGGGVLTTEGDAMRVQCTGNAVTFGVAPDEQTVRTLVGA